MRSSCATVLRCLNTCLAAGAAVVLAATAVAADGAGAGGGPAGGHSEPEHSERPRDLYGPAGAVAPSQWLSLSGHTFQRLMRMLAERSARLDAPETAPVGPPEPPDLYEPDEPAPPEEPEPVAPAGPGAAPWDRDRGGEARAGRNRSTAVRDWHRHTHSRRDSHSYRPRSCRKAGLPVGRDGWYVVADGDTLWSVAEAHYGYGGGYRRILRANWERIAFPGLIYPCQRLHIPVW